MVVGGILLKLLVHFDVWLSTVILFFLYFVFTTCLRATGQLMVSVKSLKGSAVRKGN